MKLSYLSSETTLNFDAISKKRWLDTQFLLDDDFLARAPEDVRGNLQAQRDLDYDYVKPLTRLRNQVYISLKKKRLCNHVKFLTFSLRKP